jgi:HlyD family secretion protein
MMNLNVRSKLLLGPLLLFAGLFLFGCSEKKNNDLEASGIIETTDVTVSSKVAGGIVKLNVREGDRVKAGDTLLVVDDADLQFQKEQLLAGVGVAQAQLDLLRNGSRPEDITQAEEAVRQARLNMRSAADDMKRFEELLKIGSIPEKQYTDSKTRWELTQRQLASAEAALTKLRRGSRVEEISAGRARTGQAEAQLAAIEKRIADSHLRSPVDGVVTARGVEQGEFVNIGTPVMTISRTESVKLKIYVPEDQLGRVRVGQPADLMIDTFTDRHYRGRVTYISPTAEFTPKNVQTKDDRVKLVFEVQIEVPNPTGDLKSGITADARLLPPDSVAEKGK